MFKNAWFDSIAANRDEWIKRNSYYYGFIENLVKFYVPGEASVLEVGCGTGNLIGKLKNKMRVGVDVSREMLKIANRHARGVKYIRADVEDEAVGGKYDWVLAVNLVGYLSDVYKAFEKLKLNCMSDSRVLVITYNHLWEPILKLGELLGLRSKQPEQNWLGVDDVKNIFSAIGFELVQTDFRLLVPFDLGPVSNLINNLFASLPVIRHFSLLQCLIFRLESRTERNLSVSIIVPARNEEGNIPNIIKLLPKFGKWQEIIFVEGHSKDRTWEEIKKISNIPLKISENLSRVNKYQRSNKFVVRAYKQKGMGKADAVRLGFEQAKGELLMVMDADLTVSPAELLKFYSVISQGKADFANGSRLVYPMEKESMRFLNKVGNKVFGVLLSFILGQSFKDTLCGMKALLKKDYDKIKRGRAFFGDFDPFGDFDLIFGAAKLSLKILEIPVRYWERKYGATNINRFKHGLMLLRMTFFAFTKFVFY